MSIKIIIIMRAITTMRRSHHGSIDLLIDLLNILRHANKETQVGFRRVHFREALRDLILINSLIRRALSMPCSPAHTFEPSFHESWKIVEK